MASADALLFIDANQYLDLYRTATGRKLLEPLKEQKDHIFVTAQVADEVQRRKVEVAAVFLAQQFQKLQLREFAIPGHLFGTLRSGPINKRLQNIRKSLDKVNKQLTKMAHDILGRISRSEDEVSRALEPVFAGAVRPSEDERERARRRREHGNPPGKQRDPLGDQLTWEQILTHCRAKSRLWIITKDADYATLHERNWFLNAMLYKDLAAIRQPPPEVFCFDNIPEGIKHFADTLNVKAETLPTAEEAEEITREQESLPPLDWQPIFAGGASYGQRIADPSSRTGGFYYFSPFMQPAQEVLDFPGLGYAGRHQPNALLPKKLIVVSGEVQSSPNES